MVAVAFAHSMTISRQDFMLWAFILFIQMHTQSDFAPLLVTDRPNPDVPISEPVADTTLMSKTAVDCEAVPTIDQTAEVGYSLRS